MQISDTLRRLLDQRGENYSVLAQRLGCSPSAFSRLDERRLSLNMAKALLADPIATPEERRTLTVDVLEHWLDHMEVPQADRPTIVAATQAAQEPHLTRDLIRIRRALSKNQQLVELLRSILDLTEDE